MANLIVTILIVVAITVIAIVQICHIGPAACNNVVNNGSDLISNIVATLFGIIIGKHIELNPFVIAFGFISLIFVAFVSVYYGSDTVGTGSVMLTRIAATISGILLGGFIK